MPGVGNMDRALLEYLDKLGTVTMEEAVQHFHHHTFNQVFGAVDRLSREGKIRLTRQTSFDYVIHMRRCEPAGV